MKTHWTNRPQIQGLLFPSQEHGEAGCRHRRAVGGQRLRDTATRQDHQEPPEQEAAGRALLQSLRRHRPCRCPDFRLWSPELGRETSTVVSADAPGGSTHKRNTAGPGNRMLRAGTRHEDRVLWGSISMKCQNRQVQGREKDHGSWGRGGGGLPRGTGLLLGPMDMPWSGLYMVAQCSEPVRPYGPAYLSQ